MTRKRKLKAPFPAFGGKARAAALVWSRLGRVRNYIEPFFNSGANLLLRPDPPKIETANDLDSYIANFWRATQRDPEAVAAYADGPVSEVDLHARHRWLVLSDDAAAFRERMRRDPEYYDAKVAGWWCWGLCCWIGSGWCNSPEQLERMSGSTPALAGSSGEGQGVNRQRFLEGRTAGNADCEERVPKLTKRNGVNSGDKRPKLSCGSPDSGALGTGVHANGPGPEVAEKRPQLHTGNSEHGRGVHAMSEQLPMLTGDAGASGRGVHGLPQRMPTAEQCRTGGKGVHGVGDTNRPQLADAYSRGRGVHGGDTAVEALAQQMPRMGARYDQADLPGVLNPVAGGTCAARRAWLLDWFNRLRDRLRTVRVCCGDWLRVCDSPSVTTRLGLTGIFFDPPYGVGADRSARLYAQDSLTVAADVRAYCLERGSDPMMRLALCGYAGEGHEVLEAAGWEVVAWAAHGGYGNRSVKGKANAKRERIWFSPHCHREIDLFGEST